MHEGEVIYDWNERGHGRVPPPARVALHDETLRDGIQCPSVTDPPLEEKHKILRLIDRLGVATADLGLPGAGPRAVADTEALVRQIRDEELQVKASAAARTHPADIQPILDIAERTGVPVEVLAFLGSSPIRLFAEGWDEARLEALTRQAARMTVAAGQPFTFVTEDTVRSSPTTLYRLFNAAIEEGATGLVLCDTVGHATPEGVRNLIHWTVDLLRGLGVRDRVRLHWHGHNDRGLGVINTLAAFEAGCDVGHGTILGIGERVGNTSLDQLLVNLRLQGTETAELAHLAELVTLVSASCQVPIPVSYPVFGADAFRTGTGVHAAAILKARAKGDDWLADRIYSGVPAGWFGLRQVVEIGHQSGISNVRYWLADHGVPANEAVVEALMARAKTLNRVLTDAEVWQVVRSVTP